MINFYFILPKYKCALVIAENKQLATDAFMQIAGQQFKEITTTEPKQKFMVCVWIIKQRKTT